MSTIIEITGLTKKFGIINAVNKLNLSVPEGVVYGFLGPNSAGKTTTIKMLMGLITPEQGTISIMGSNALSEGVRLRQYIGYIPENQVFYHNMTVDDTINFTKGFYQYWDQAIVASYIKQFNLSLSQKVCSLSKGAKVQLALIVALGPHPRLLILDEPTSGLDPIVRRDFLTTILSEVTANGQTVFLSSHNLQDIQKVADRIGIIHHGHMLLEGDSPAVIQQFYRITYKPAVPLDESILTKIKTYCRVEPEGHGYQFIGRDNQTEVQQYLQTIPYEHMETAHLNLEEVFWEILRK